MASNSVNDDGLIVVGANHRSSTMLFRDRITIRNGQLGLFMDRLNDAGIGHSLVTSNSDRTEIYVEPTLGTDSVAEIVKLLSAQSGLSRSHVGAQTYGLSGRDALRHLLAVCCRLDGLVIGDPRPAHNLRDGLVSARKKNLTGRVIEFAMTSAFNAADRVHRETEIGRRPVSIPAAAVQVARDLHGDLTTCTGILVGDGQMGELLANSFLSSGLKTLVAVHPIPTKAEAIGRQLNCHVSDIEMLPALLAKSDIVLTSLNSRRFTLSIDLIQSALKQRRRKPIFLIDIGVPGDIDQAIESLEDAYLYSLDDLERVTRTGWESREKEAEKAWAIVDEETDKLFASLSGPLSRHHEKETPSDGLEILRQEVLREAGGDADRATQMILNRLRDNYRIEPARLRRQDTEEDQ